MVDKHIRLFFHCYAAGLRNFFNLYSPLANSWQFYDNSDANHLDLIALKVKNHIHVKNNSTWESLVEAYDGKEN